MDFQYIARLREVGCTDRELSALVDYLYLAENNKEYGPEWEELWQFLKRNNPMWSSASNNVYKAHLEGTLTSDMVFQYLHRKEDK